MVGILPCCAGPWTERLPLNRTIARAWPSVPWAGCGARCCSARGLRADRHDKLLKLFDTGGQNCTPNDTPDRRGDLDIGVEVTVIQGGEGTQGCGERQPRIVTVGRL